MTDEATPRGDRDLTWDGCFNVRDLGGLPAGGGKRIRPGAVVRSDSIDNLTPAGWAALQAHGVMTVVDLRNDDERAADAGPRPLGLTTVHVPLDDVDFWARMHREQRDGSPLYYRPFLTHKPERVAAAVTAVARAGPGGVLVHCAGGRDRTGLVTVLLLAVADVPSDRIAADNEASTVRLPPLFAKLGIPDETAEIQTALDRHHTTIRAEITGLLHQVDVNTYLRAAGVTAADLHALRERLVGRAAGRET